MFPVSDLEAVLDSGRGDGPKVPTSGLPAERAAEVGAGGAVAPVFVSVVMPVKNEAAHIDHCLESVLRQDYPADALELIVADGMSTDGTRQRLEEWSRRDSRVRIVDNPAGFVSHGLNAAIGAARGEIVVRMDAHTEYARDYVSQCVASLFRSGADNVGGPWRAEGRTYLQRAIALAFSSGFSSGGARSHAVTYEGWVDSVYLGCWRKATLEELGGFDEELARNQDDELNLRLIRAGGQIWQTPKIRSWYYPRASLAALFRQYSQYGYWKTWVIRKHRQPASLRHVMPGLCMAFFACVTAMAMVYPPYWQWVFWLFGAYMTANLVATLQVARKPRLWRYLPVLPVVFAMFHLGYGYGFLRGLSVLVGARPDPPAGFITLTRGGGTRQTQDGGSNGRT